MKPGGSIAQSQGSPIIRILSRINPIPRIDTYFFKIDSNIVLTSTPGPSWKFFYNWKKNKEVKNSYIRK